MDSYPVPVAICQILNSQQYGHPDAELAGGLLVAHMPQTVKILIGMDWKPNHCNPDWKGQSGTVQSQSGNPVND